MSETRICPICNGRKSIMSEGFMERECEVCKGKGMVEAEDLSVLPEDQLKKRGRPKKNA